MIQRSVLALVLPLAVASASVAQKIGGSPDARRPAYNLRSAAVLPIGFFRDEEPLGPTVHKESKDMFRDTLASILERSGVKQVDQATVNAAYAQDSGQRFDVDRYGELPKPEDLVRLGKHLNVDLVIVARCRWHVKSVTTITGLKTKSSAKVDLWIVNVRNSEFDLHVTGMMADDTEADSLVAIAATLFVFAPAAFLSGGAEAPHMQRAGVAGLIKAIKPWAEKQDTKIG